MRFGFIQPHVVPHLAENRITVLPLFHVDEIDNDQSADITESDLSGDFSGSFTIDLENGVVLFSLILMRTGYSLAVPTTRRWLAHTSMLLSSDQPDGGGN